MIAARARGAEWPRRNEITQGVEPGLFTPRDANGAERAIETRGVNEGESLRHRRLRFGLRCAHE